MYVCIFYIICVCMCVLNIKPLFHTAIGLQASTYKQATTIQSYIVNIQLSGTLIISHLYIVIQ